MRVSSATMVRIQVADPRTNEALLRTLKEAVLQR